MRRNDITRLKTPQLLSALHGVGVAISDTVHNFSPHAGNKKRRQTVDRFVGRMDAIIDELRGRIGQKG